MHLNLLLCQSHTPLSTSFLSSWFPPPSPLPHPPPPSYLHYSSSSELSLISPLLAPPSLLFSSCTSIRQQTGNSTGSDSGFQSLTFTVSVFIIQVLLRWLLMIHLHNHEIGIGTLVRYFLQKLSANIYLLKVKRKYSRNDNYEWFNLDLKDEMWRVTFH